MFVYLFESSGDGREYADVDSGSRNGGKSFPHFSTFDGMQMNEMMIDESS